MMARPTLPARDLERIRRTRRHPTRTQPDYVVLMVLVHELERVLGAVSHPVVDVLDLFAATQPYRDLLPPHANYVSMDIDEHYGPQDVASDEFLPFADDSFDLVLFTEAFHYVTEPEQGVAELNRVLRPGGTLVLTMPLVWEYDRRIVERRYTGPALARAVRGLGRRLGRGDRRLCGRLGNPEWPHPARPQRVRAAAAAPCDRGPAARCLAWRSTR